MKSCQMRTDEEGYQRLVNPPKPQFITLTPNQVGEILYDMGLEAVDVESFIVAAHQRGLTSEHKEQPN